MSFTGTYFKSKTYTLTGAGGEVIDLGTPTRTLTLKIDDGGGECWVRPSQFPNMAAAAASAAPSAPGSSPAGAGDALSADGWIHLKGAGSSYTPPTRDGVMRFVEIYDVAAGGLQLITE